MFTSPWWSIKRRNQFVNNLLIQVSIIWRCMFISWNKIKRTLNFSLHSKRRHGRYKQCRRCNTLKIWFRRFDLQKSFFFTTANTLIWVVIASLLTGWCPMLLISIGYQFVSLSCKLVIFFNFAIYFIQVSWLKRVTTGGKVSGVLLFMVII